MGYAKYFVSPITSTSLTHCTPGITIVYTTVHAIGLPGGWHRQSETTFAADISIESPVACPSHKDKFFPSSSFSKKNRSFFFNETFKEIFREVIQKRSRSRENKIKMINMMNDLEPNCFRKYSNSTSWKHASTLVPSNGSGGGERGKKRKPDRSRSIDLSAKTRTGCGRCAAAGARISIQGQDRISCSWPRPITPAEESRLPARVNVRGLALLVPAYVSPPPP